jgi:hypothetical protein
MLYQDTLTGTLHEVPDSQVYGWGLGEDPYGVGEAQMVYDGLGNPLGWGFLKSLVKRAVPFATSMLGPYGQIIKHALPVVAKALGPTAQAMRQQALQQLAGVPVALPTTAPINPMAARPLPRGWRRPPIPYTGPRPRRVYLRCSAWPGPRGLVPVNAGAAVPAGPPVVAPPVVAPPVVAARGRYRSRGRRR